MTDSPDITNTDASGQGYIFPLASPLPGRNPAADESAERELLARAHDFARPHRPKTGKRRRVRRSPRRRVRHGRQDTAHRSGKPLVASCGAETLRPRVRRFVFKPADIETVLRGEKPKRIVGESRLDKLFARSSAYLSIDKFVELIHLEAARVFALQHARLFAATGRDATHWVTASQWRKKFNRKVKDNTHPLIMLQPMGPLVYDVTDTRRPTDLAALLADLFAVEGSFNFDIFDSTLENYTRVGIVIKYWKSGAHHAGTATRAPRDRRQSHHRT